MTEPLLLVNSVIALLFGYMMLAVAKEDMRGKKPMAKVAPCYVAAAVTLFMAVAGISHWIEL